MSARVLSYVESGLVALNFALLYVTPQAVRGAASLFHLMWASAATSASERRGLPKSQTIRTLKK